MVRVYLRLLGTWKGRIGPVEGQAVKDSCNASALQPEIHAMYQITYTP